MSFLFVCLFVFYFVCFCLLLFVCLFVFVVVVVDLCCCWFFFFLGGGGGGIQTVFLNLTLELFRVRLKRNRKTTEYFENLIEAAWSVKSTFLV